MAHAEEPIGYLENYEPLHPRRREAEADRSGSVESSNTCAQIGIRTSSILSGVFSGTAKTFTQRRAQARMPTGWDRSEMDWEGSRADNGPAHADHVTHDAAKNPEIARARGELVSQRTVQPIVTARETVQPSWLQGDRRPRRLGTPARKCPTSRFTLDASRCLRCSSKRLQRWRRDGSAQPASPITLLAGVDVSHEQRACHCWSDRGAAALPAQPLRV